MKTEMVSSTDADDLKFQLCVVDFLVTLTPLLPIYFFKVRPSAHGPWPETDEAVVCDAENKKESKRSTDLRKTPISMQGSWDLSLLLML